MHKNLIHTENHFWGPPPQSWNETHAVATAIWIWLIATAFWCCDGIFYKLRDVWLQQARFTSGSMMLRQSTRIPLITISDKTNCDKSTQSQSKGNGLAGRHPLTWIAWIHPLSHPVVQTCLPQGTRLMYCKSDHNLLYKTGKKHQSLLQT